MSLIPDKSILLLADDKSTIFNSAKALSWSHDNKLVLCCAEKLAIINLVINTHPIGKTEPYTARVEEMPDISSLDTFSVASGLLNFKASMYNLNKDDRQRLSSDPSLTEEFHYLNPMFNTFKRAVCSPMCLQLDGSQNLIAASTYSHRVLIYGERPEGWAVLLDCSDVIKEHTICNMKLPVILGQTMTLDNYIDLVQEISTVEIEWSTVFSLNGNSEQSFLLLFAGAVSGAITVWKVCIPFETREDFTFQCKDRYTSEVTALSWFSKENDQGYLAAGYLDGSVRIISVNVNYDVPTSGIIVTEMFADLSHDDLAISDLAWASIDKNTTALICCKNNFLSLYSICNNTIKLVHHYHMDVGSPLTSISTFNACGVASSRDGVIINFECKHESGQMSLEWSIVAITCKPSNPDVEPWLCLGIALSPRSGLCLSAHRISHNCNNMGMRRRFMNRQMIALSVLFNLTAEKVKESLGTESVPFSPQDIMINLRLHIQQIIHVNGSLQDILQIYSELNERDDILSTQVVRDMLLFLKHCSATRRDIQKELEWVSSAFENVTEKLVIKHIGSCLQKVTSAPTSNELTVIKAMLNWITARNITSPHVSQSLDLARLVSQSPDLHCAICDSQLKIIGFLLAQCVNGHQMKLCALSMLPCQDLSWRKCEACDYPSVSLNALSDVKIITLKQLCILCGGHLRHSIL